jgi:hypothetical protein
MIDFYETQEDMDDAFESMMEKEQDKARLREQIEEARGEVESRYEDLISAKEELADLEKQLLEM